MITCHRKCLEERCRERGYRLEDVMGCVVHQNGDQWTVDPEHPAYPRDRKPRALPGQELAAILKKLGMAPVESCKCKGRAKKMDAWGPDGCEKHINEIVGWLEEEAKNRRLPFLRWPAKTLVRLAIHRSRRHKMLPHGT